MTTTNYDPRILKAPHPVPGAPNNWKRFFSFNTDAKVIKFSTSPPHCSSCWWRSAGDDRAR